jgi:hypothetical protein
VRRAVRRYGSDSLFKRLLLAQGLAVAGAVLIFSALMDALGSGVRHPTDRAQVDFDLGITGMKLGQHGQQAVSGQLGWCAEHHRPARPVLGQSYEIAGGCDLLDRRAAGVEIGLAIDREF